MINASQSTLADCNNPANDTPDNRTLILVRPNLDDIPKPMFPQGFNVRGYRKGDERTWTRIWRDAEPFDTIKDSTFRDSLGHDEATLSERVSFVVDENAGETIGTVTAWTEPTPSESHAGLEGWGRVHWIAVVPEYQGRGVGKALFSYCLQALKAFGHRETFLVTSAGRTGAVALYKKYDFVEESGGHSTLR